jgi:glycine/D-amino acid oxidase-like deaminating enzyme
VWTFHREYQNEGSNRDLDPIFPPPIPKDYALHVLQGISHIFPGTNAYISTHTNSNISTQSQLLCKHQIVAGYYTKTQDNQPMIGPILRNEAGQNVQGLWVYGALSGHGIMISLGGAELLAKRLFASGQISTKQGMDHTQDNVAARRYILEDTIKDTWFQVNIGDFTDSINAITDQM